MSLSIFTQAFVATFAMLCVIGPICMTVINTTIIHGFRIGIFAGLGVSVADTLYVIGASLAISALESILQSKAITVVGICGGLFLYYLAYRFWHTKPSADTQQISGSRIKSFITLFCLTLTGPTTMITYSVVFSSFLGNYNFDALSAILGGCLGIYLFYLLVVSIVAIIRTKLSNKVIIMLNKIATITITILATLLVFNGFKSLFI